MLLPARLRRPFFVLSENRKKRSIARPANYSRLSGSNPRPCCVGRLSDSPSRCVSLCANECERLKAAGGAAHDAEVQQPWQLRGASSHHRGGLEAFARGKRYASRRRAAWSRKRPRRQLARIALSG